MFDSLWRKPQKGSVLKTSSENYKPHCSLMWMVTSAMDLRSVRQFRLHQCVLVLRLLQYSLHNHIAYLSAGQMISGHG